MKSRRDRKKVFITVYIFAFALLILLGWVIVNKGNTTRSVAVIGILGGCLFIIYCFAHFMIARRFLNLGFIFTLILFLFCFGQFIMYGLGVQYDYFFTNSYYRSLFNNEDYYILYGETVSILAIGLFQLATLVSIKITVRNKEKATIPHKSLMFVSGILFVVSFPIMVIYKIYIMGYSFANGYAAANSIAQPFAVRFIGIFFVPSAIGLLVCNIKRDGNYRFLCLLLILYSLLGLATGGRTEPLIIMTGMAVLTLYKKRINFKSKIAFIVIVYFAVTLFVTIADVRELGESWISRIAPVFFENLITFKTITQIICEMGFSGSSTVWTIYLVETGQQSLYGGLSYVGALANIFPSALDAFGVLNVFDKFCHLEGFLTERFGFDFGVGFNLIAEAYLNFSLGSIVVMFFYGLLLNRIFNIYNQGGAWNLYKSVVMFSVLLTLPRRASLYLADQWALCVIIIWILCKIANPNKVKSKRMLINAKVAY